MPLEKPQVEQVARLAGLNLTSKETEKMFSQLSLIVDFFDQLREVDTSAVACGKQSPQVANVFRQDHICPSLPRRKVLGSAKESDGEYFLVPKVLG